MDTAPRIRYPFFRPCPFCKRVEIVMKQDEWSSVGCLCGEAFKMKITMWLDLYQASERWNTELEESLK